MRHRRRQLLAALVATLLIAAAAGAHALGPKDRRLTSLRTGITIEAPAGWTLSQHTGYRETVALMLHPDGSRISVTAALTRARDAAALFQQNQSGLSAQGLTVTRSAPGPRGSVVAEGSAPARNEVIRQIYLVRDVPRGRQAVVLTLVCRASLLATHGAALDFSASRLAFEVPIESTSPSPASRGDGRGGPDAGASAGEPGPPALNRDAGAQQTQKR